MKFIYCPECQDAVLLHISDEPRKCLCGKSWGRYTDEENASIGGEAIPFGINNNAFSMAFKGALFTFEGWFYHGQAILDEHIHREEPENA